MLPFLKISFQGCFKPKQEFSALIMDVKYNSKYVFLHRVVFKTSEEESTEICFELSNNDILMYKYKLSQ